MAPYEISIDVQLSELYEKIHELEEEIKMNNDLQDFLDKQSDRDEGELIDLSLCYQIWQPDSPEYREIIKKERRLRRSRRYAKRGIEELKEDNKELQREIDDINIKVTQLKKNTK